MGLFASLSAVLLVVPAATAQTETPATSATPAAADATPVKLPYGVEDVLKLSRAQVNEDVILTYIRNTGTIYNLAPKDIVYLRNQGVSDRVVNAMQDQRKNVPAELAAQTPPPSTAAAPQAPVTSDANAGAAPQYAPAYVQAAPTYVAPQPTYEPASTLYVIPYPYAGYRYPGYYPYSYGGYYGYGGPSVVFGFGYNNWGHYGHYNGGYHGRYYGGGHYGYHGHH
jgi:hypothetical protein